MPPTHSTVNCPGWGLAASKDYWVVSLVLGILILHSVKYASPTRGFVSLWPPSPCLKEELGALRFGVVRLKGWHCIFLGRRGLRLRQTTDNSEPRPATMLPEVADSPGSVAEHLPGTRAEQGWATSTFPFTGKFERNHPTRDVARMRLPAR